MQALGRLFDLAPDLAPYDSNAAAGTGLRVGLADSPGGVDFVVFKGAGSGTDVPVLTLREHSAASGGTSQALARITEHYRKSATTLAGTETWTRTTQAAASTLTLTGEATKQGIYVVHVEASWLSDGFGYVSLDVADTGAAGAQLLAVLAITTGLASQRSPQNLPAVLR